MRYLDGKRLKGAINAGWLRLDHNRERLRAVNVFPVADGKIILIGKARGEEKLIGKIISRMPEDTSGGRWAVGHPAAPYRVNNIVSVLKERFGADKITTAEIGPAVGTHPGPGTWGIFFMRG